MMEEDREIIATFTVFENGTVKIWINEKYIKENSNGQ